jgi:GDPmannose 4,6-dehydratase
VSVVGLDRLRAGDLTHGLSDRQCTLLDCVSADLTDTPSLEGLLEEHRPDAIYHLAAQSNVARSFEIPQETMAANAQGTLALLEAVRRVSPASRLFFAATADLFGDPASTPQNEDTPFRPRSPYGVSKLAGFHLVRIYRERHGLFACSGILYNHESPRRPDSFVTRKITRTAARIKLGLETGLTLGNLDAVRDWGYADDTVAAMQAFLAASQPRDLVIGTGRGHTVRDFAAAAFARLDLAWQDHVTVDPALVRPAESQPLVADPSRARETLGWEPATAFEDLVGLMVDADLEREEKTST